LRELLGDQSEVAGNVGLRVRAHQQQRRTQLVHQLELPFGAIEIALQLLGRDALEIAERLEEVDAQSEIFRDAANVGGRSRELQQIVFEDLHAVEARGSNRVQFLAQHARNRHGRDRVTHALLHTAGAAAPQNLAGSAQAISMRSMSPAAGTARPRKNEPAADHKADTRSANASR
jgi:hypothetical protein